MRVYRMIWERDGNFYIGLSQIIDNNKDDKFRVVYGKQIWNNLSYGEASKKLGEAIMHCCAAEGLIQ